MNFIRVSFFKQPNLFTNISTAQAVNFGLKNKFIQHKDRAEAFLTAGEFEQIKTKNIAETAALMQVNQMIFNLDETTVK